MRHAARRDRREHGVDVERNAAKRNLQRDRRRRSIRAYAANGVDAEVVVGLHVVVREADAARVDEGRRAVAAQPLQVHVPAGQHVRRGGPSRRLNSSSSRCGRIDVVVRASASRGRRAAHDLVAERHVERRLERLDQREAVVRRVARASTRARRAAAPSAPPRRRRRRARTRRRCRARSGTPSSRRSATTSRRLAAALHHVAETDDLIDRIALEVREHRLERDRVAVDVRDQRGARSREVTRIAIARSLRSWPSFHSPAAACAAAFASR